MPTDRRRFRSLGLTVGQLPPGPLNAITDVAGVKVGYATIVEDGPKVLRTGVTAVLPCEDDLWARHLFAGCHSFNGNGELTGAAWLQEQGLLSSPVCITNTNCVGSVRDALCAYAIETGAPQMWHLPVVGETCDAWLSDPSAFPVGKDATFAALKDATSGLPAEGNVGGGTGMIAHEFKGGTGTASRCVVEDGVGYTVGALVQANYGARGLLRVDGHPVGRWLGPDVVPLPREKPTDMGSIICVIATDAPLLPIQCQRLARRATIGLAWVGGVGNNGSGDIFIAFSTANRIGRGEGTRAVQMMSPDSISGLFLAAAEAVEEAILNALCMAEAMTGFQGRTVHALPLDLLADGFRDRPDPHSGPHPHA